MPWLPIYATTADIESIRAWLNAETAVAFVVGATPGRWVAQATIDSFDQSRICLWHVPSGPLPLVSAEPGEAPSWIDNPWSGWQERRAGADSSVPYFGAGHPGTVWLNVRRSSPRDPEILGLSSFEWIGNHYRIIGNTAHPDTERWWQRLKRWVKKNSILVPRGGLASQTEPEIWALPHARERLLAGIAADVNPF
jgi:hypothetical protein